MTDLAAPAPDNGVQFILPGHKFGAASAIMISAT
jgi:hypothetical protein